MAMLMGGNYIIGILKGTCHHTELALTYVPMLRESCI